MGSIELYIIEFMVDIIVIGAGISGLTCAFYAKRAGLSVELLESSSRAGGVITSERRDDFLLEFGPNTVQPTAELMELTELLGLQNQMLLTSPRLPRFIQYENHLHPVPLSPRLLVTSSLLTLRGKLRILCEPFISKNKEPNESLLDFMGRRFGREVAERLLAPFVSGVWAGDAARLSPTAFSSLSRWEDKYGSVIKGMIREKKRNGNEPPPPKGLLSFQNGLETLPKALAVFLSNDLKLNVSVQEVKPNAGQKDQDPWIIETSDGRQSAKRVIFSQPAAETARLIRPFSPDGAKALEDIPYASLAVLYLSLRRDDVRHPLHGFGHLVAPSEKSDILGCLWSSSIFPNRAPKSSVLLTVFMGGAARPEILHQEDKDLYQRAVQALAPHLGFSQPPTLLCLKRYASAIPQYTIGHEARLSILQESEKKFPGLSFAGNVLAGISVGDVIRHAKKIITD